MKLKAGENINEETIAEAERILAEGGTKKAACEALGINYNTTRLAKIIQEFNEQLETAKRIRAEKRKQPVTDSEISFWIEEYLSGESIESISKRAYRSSALIDKYITNAGAKLRANRSDTYFRPEAMPDECVTDSFDIGEYAWSMKYNGLVKILKKYSTGYGIYVLGDYSRHASQPVEELASLKHLEKYNLNWEAICLNT